MCFIFSLGNRPQGSKWGYTLAFIGFGLITIYMTVREKKKEPWLWPGTITDFFFNKKVIAFLLAFKGIENIAHSDGPLNAGDLFTNPIFRNIVLSLLATLGLYVIASLIFVSALAIKKKKLSIIHYLFFTQFEPWHMITSFIQYLLMAPSYIAVLNVYAVRSPH